MCRDNKARQNIVNFDDVSQENIKSIIVKIVF